MTTGAAASQEPDRRGTSTDSASKLLASTHRFSLRFRGIHVVQSLALYPIPDDPQPSVTTTRTPTFRWSRSFQDRFTRPRCPEFFDAGSRRSATPIRTRTGARTRSQRTRASVVRQSIDQLVTQIKTNLAAKIMISHRYHMETVIVGYDAEVQKDIKASKLMIHGLITQNVEDIVIEQEIKRRSVRTQGAKAETWPVGFLAGKGEVPSIWVIHPRRAARHVRRQRLDPIDDSTATVPRSRGGSRRLCIALRIAGPQRMISRVDDLREVRRRMGERFLATADYPNRSQPEPRHAVSRKRHGESRRPSRSARSGCCHWE
jgi:hypothetical protein